MIDPYAQTFRKAQIRGLPRLSGAGPHTCVCKLMRLLGPIAALTQISAKLTADRGGVSVHDAGDVALLVSSALPQDKSLPKGWIVASSSVVTEAV